MRTVRPKKHLGQHFLKDEALAQRITQQLTGHGSYGHLLEVGPGTGVLTQFLAQAATPELHLSEVDSESVAYLQKRFPALAPRLYHADFLKMDFSVLFGAQPFAVIGNFPYNISSQIFFRVLEHRQQVPEVVGMVQHEVGARMAAPPGSKTYGILSVLLQAYYDVEYLFTVPPTVFVPPPKVQSAVLRLRRNGTARLDCDERAFFRTVKQAFQNRRKTLRNALRPLWQGLEETPELNALLARRAETLSVAEFVWLTRTLTSAPDAARA